MVDVSELFYARKKDIGVTVLVPGLAVPIQGTYNAQNQLVPISLSSTASLADSDRHSSRSSAGGADAYP